MKIYDFLQDICNMIKLYCLSMIVPFIIFIYYKLPYDMEIAFVLFGIILITYCINSLVHRLPLFCILHLLLFLPPFYIGLTIWGQVICILFLIMVTVMDFIFWFSKHNQKIVKFPTACLVIFVGIYIYSDSMGRYSFANASFYLGQFYVIASLADLYLENMHFLPTEDNAALINPKKSVLTRNNNYVIGILTGILAFNCIIHLSFIEEIFSFILSKISQLMKFLLGLLLNSEESYEIMEEDPAMASNVELPEPGNPSILSQILSFLFIFAAICFIFYMIYKAISFIYQLIKEHLNRDFGKSDSLDEDIFEVSEDLKVQRKHHKSIFKLNMSLQQKVRKRYQQEINHQIKHGFQNRDSYTPNDRSNQLLSSGQADIHDLTSCYNKARYSEHPITAKEWNRIK